MTWKSSEPETDDFLNSADHRANFAAIQNSLWGRNLLADPSLVIWSGGDAVAPDHWSLSGDGAVIARSTAQTKIESWSALLQAGSSALSEFAQSVLTSDEFFTALAGRSVSAGAWLFTGTASGMRLKIEDGTTSPGYSSYHTGSTAWEFVKLVHALATDASLIRFLVENSVGTSGYAQALVFTLGEVPSTDFVPGVSAIGTLRFPFASILSTELNKARFSPTRPLLVRGVGFSLVTAATSGGVVTIDANHYDGSASQSMFSTTSSGGNTRPSVDGTGPLAAWKEPDGTYQYRCIGALTPSSASTALDNSQLRIDLDVGASPNSDLDVAVQVLQFQRPLEPWITSTGQN